MNNKVYITVPESEKERLERYKRTMARLNGMLGNMPPEKIEVMENLAEFITSDFDSLEHVQQLLDLSIWELAYYKLEEGEPKGDDTAGLYMLRKLREAFGAALMW